MSAESMLLSFIQECVRDGRYLFTHHALTNHPPREGFTERDALEAIANRTIIEHRERESRCIVAGPASELGQSSEYISNYIHCVCRYDSVQQIVIITMYRPRHDAWINALRRR